MLFAAIGTAVECATKEEYDLLAAASSLMATYFGILDDATQWLCAKGLSEPKARAYLAPLFAELTRSAVKEESTNLGRLSQEFATKGGLNEQVLSDFQKAGGSAALVAALDVCWNVFNGSPSASQPRRSCRISRRRSREP